MKQRKKILIVEDEYVGALSLSEMLGHQGYDVCEIASTGKGAVRIAGKERPDIVLMDIGLTGKMTGIEAAKEINCRFGIPIIFMSGYLESEVRKQIDLCGPFRFIDKPLDFDRLETMLAAI